MNLSPLLATDAARFRVTFTPLKGMNLHGIEPVLRGRLGCNLRRACCPFPDSAKRRCEICALLGNCLYVTLFASDLEKSAAGDRSIPSAIQPFVPSVDAHSGTETIAPGESGDAVFTLFGPAIEHCSLFMEAAASALISLSAEIDAVEPMIPWDSTPRLAGPLSEWIEQREIGNKKPIMRFLTPLRLVKNGRLQDGDLRFELIVSALLRRLRDLKRAYGTDRNMGQTEGIFREAMEAVKVSSYSLKWAGRKRYSKRQRQSVFLDGFLGHVVLEGPCEPFLPLLKAAEIVHVGKGTSSGCGRVRIE